MSKDKEATDEESKNIVVDLHIAKHRNGESGGKIKLNFVGPEVRFETMTEAQREKLMQSKKSKEEKEEGQPSEYSENVDNVVAAVGEFDYSKFSAEEVDPTMGIDGLTPPPENPDEI